VHYDGLNVKVRRIVSRVRKFGVAMKTVRTGPKMWQDIITTDNTTRWNSSYMAKRVLGLRGPVNDVLAEMKIDSLFIVAEWSRLAELVTLLEPPATQTDNLQSNTYRLSLIYPFTVRPPVSSAIDSAM
jgi:hypothetical protein